MQVIRGDDYQSWLYSFGDDLIAVDPWLTNQQQFPILPWLLKRDASERSYLISNNLIDKVTALIITAHFSDHLDAKSLSLFAKSTPIFTTNEAMESLVKLGFTSITVVKVGRTYKLGAMDLTIHEAGHPYQTTTFAYLIECNSKRLFHEAHMVSPALRLEPLDAVILSVDQVKVFGLIQVSMNLDQARLVAQKLNADYLLPTGIAPSKTRGLIAKLLYIKEFYNKLSTIHAVCRKSGDSLIL